MLHNLDLRLEMINPVANHWRQYTLQINQDLFGFTEVVINYGRIDCLGRTTRIFAHDAADALAIVIRCLKRRQTAKARLGADYMIVRLIAEEAAIKKLNSVMEMFEWRGQQSVAAA